ncbi:MAG: TPM domain-containing protein [Candidatus Pelethousia sp.]|nr:TPM domain-containing protein [Candidatus Pelethousia sp.]
MMVRNRLMAILLAVLLLFASSAALAVEEPRVYDQAGLLSTAEVDLLEERIAELRNSLGVDIVLLTADEGVYDTTDYADMFYENNGFGAGDNASGVLFFIDMQNRVSWISTTGNMIDYIDDPREEMILDDQAAYLADGDFYGAFSVALDWTDSFVTDGVGAGHYAYDEESGQILDPGTYGSDVTYESAYVEEGFRIGVLGVLVCLALGAGAGFIARAIVQHIYNKDFKAVSYAFREKSSLNLTINSSVCTGKFVTTRIIPKAEDSNRSGGGGSFGGGGSGVHHSSGGGSHGGGGRGF